MEIHFPIVLKAGKPRRGISRFAFFLVCRHHLFIVFSYGLSLCVYVSDISLGVQLSLLVRLPVRLNTDSCLWPHFIWITSLKPFSTNMWCSEVLGLVYQHMNFERHRSAHDTLLSTFYQDRFCFFFFTSNFVICVIEYKYPCQRQLPWLNSFKVINIFIKFIQSDKYFKRSCNQ